MTAAARTFVEVRPPPEEGRLVRCKECGQVLAIRTPSGKRLHILNHCEIDEDGRYGIECPVCHSRRRIPRIDERH